jgi:membrane-associated PAP2 superfamily phosphatase
MGTKTKRKLIATVVAVLTVLNYMIIPVSADEVMNWESIRTAVNGATGATTITLTNDIDVAKGEETIVIGGGKKITLDLAGYTITRISSSANHTDQGFFDVNDSNTEFTLKDSSGNNSGKLTGAYAEGSTACIYVGNGAKFIMDGGSITGNTAYNYDGAAVYLAGGGSFTMNGGVIEGNNSTRVSTGGRGGAVYLNYSGYSYYPTASSFTMNGGVIKNNGSDETYRGGAVYVNRYCTFTMNDGEISGNKATYRGNSGNGQGGAVYIENYTATFNMNKGSISGNAAVEGGGVYINATSGNNRYGVFRLNGGSITNNTGSGVFVSRYAYMYLGSDNPIVVTGNKNSDGDNSNVFLNYYNSNTNSTLYIRLSGALKTGSKIGVRSTSSTAPIRVTSGYNTYHSNTDPNTYFTSDQLFTVGRQSNEVYFTTCNHIWGQPTYTWAEEDDGSWTCTATRVCSRDSHHPDIETVTATRTTIDAATCTETGTDRLTATFKNTAFVQQTKDIETPVIPHTGVKTEANAATCTEAGNSEYWTCSVCGKYFSDEECTNEIAENSWVIEALGHDMEKVEAVAATCTTAGNSEYYKCTRCGKFFSDAAGENEIAENSWVIEPLGHDLEKVEAVAATCTTAGNSEYYKCKTCGKFFSDAAGENEIAENSWVIEPLGHDLEKVEAVPASCTTAGNSEYYKCKTCGKFFSDAAGENEIAENSWVIEPLGHDLEKVEAVAATCTTAGNIEHYKCKTCGKCFSDPAGENEISEESCIIPALGHDLEKVEAVAATCTTAGNSEYYKCKTCGKFFSDAAGENEIAENSWVIEPLGHDLEKVEAVAATCTTAGNSEYYKCKTCNKFFSDAAGENEIAENSWVIDPLGHDLEKVEAVAATCTTAGNTEYYKCTRCGKFYSDAAGENEIAENSWVIEPLGHNLEKVEAVAATCTTAGNSEYYKCKTCNKFFSDAAGENEIAENSWVIEALGHDLEKVEAVAATCTTAGNTEYYKCTRCGKFFSDAAGENEIAENSWVIEPLGHDLEKVEAVAATCTTAGNTEYYKCTRCGKFYSDAAGENEIAENSWVIEPLGHDMEKVEAVAATCTTAGNSEYYKCTRCGKFYSDAAGENEIAENSWVIEPLGHDMEKVEAVAATCTTAGNTEYYKCTRCGKFYSDAAGENEIAENSWVIEPLGHTLTKTDAVPATCETAGNGEYWTCSVCGKHFSDAAGKTEISENAWIIPAGHTLVKVDAVDPTCEDNGNIEYWKCTACGKLFSDDKCTTEYEAEQVVLFAAHKPVSVAAIPATCTDFGYEAGTKCSVCGKTIDGCGKLPMLDHTPVEVPEEPATCTKAGTTAGSKCSVCGTVLEGCDPIEPLGHNWGDWKVTKPATVDAKGEETRTCSRCDASETRDIAKLTPAPGSDVTLKLDKSSMNVICGQTGTIKATVKGTTDKVTWKSSNTKIATVDANGKVTAKQAGSVTITATVAGKKATCKVQILYKDVTNTSEFWYAPTYYLTDKNVVKGYANQTEFRPANVCTRAQMVTFIWRLMGEPAPKAKTCKFNDVKETDYFYKACIWGNENHIVEGYKDGSFGPQITCARKHAVTFLWRLAGKPEPKTKENKFSDVKTKDYYYKATLWASETKILAGYDDGTFRPEGDCLRRQMVTFLYKYDKFVNAKKG